MEMGKNHRVQHGLLTPTDSPHRVNHGRRREGAGGGGRRIGGRKHFIGSCGGHAHSAIAALGIGMGVRFQSHVRRHLRLNING